MNVRILLVDDEKPMVEMLRIFLAPIASLIDEAQELRPALEMARTNNYNIVILDLRLKSTGKEEALAAIGEFKRDKTSVVVVSGLPEPDLKQEVMDAGASAFVAKTSDHFPQALLVATNIATLKLPHDSFHSRDYLGHVRLLEQLATSEHL